LFPAQDLFPFLISNIVSSVFVGGLIRMAHRQVRGGAPRLEDLFSVTDVWFDLILVALLSGAGFFLGFMFFAIPGFIVSGLWMLAIPLVVEGHLPATGALIQSFHALKSQWLIATLFHVVLIIAAVSGVALCGVGLLFTGPLYALAIAILYREFFPGSATMTWKKSQPEPFPEF
jgi:uncharacterized membrane protein